MQNRNIERRDAKRRRVNSSPAIQNQSLPRKMIIILDDTWLEALKHLTCPQWSKMSLVSGQINGIVQRNISRLPRQVIESITLNLQDLLFPPRTTSIARTLQKFFHPASYVKNVAMHAVNQELIDSKFNGEERYIRCQKFDLLPRSNMSSMSQKIAKSLEWLERNVRCDSILLYKWMFNRIHKRVEIRAMLTNFIFDASQKCKAQELVFTYSANSYHYDFNDLSSMKLVDILIEDFLALSVVQGTIPTVVIDRYPTEEQHRARFGKNVIGREVDSQDAVALYIIENGQKRIRISFCRVFNGNGGYKAYLKFYTI
ncbi:hypothetical protein Ddc_22954 [Ditylenchus destructor]|nr:hypothetical protein Ddc_22954 [Ditylenchus destructor]